MKQNIKWLFFAGMLALTVGACTKYADPPPVFEDLSTGDSTQGGGRKVLLIGIDGGVGPAFKAIKPPAITELLKHSKYSFDGISETATTDAATWKSMVTGVSYELHGIRDSSFIYTPPSGTDEHKNIKTYPSFLNYLLTSSKGLLNTVTVSSWKSWLGTLLADSKKQIQTADDKQVKDSAVAQLKNGDPDLMVLEFSGLNQAGKQGAFSASDPGYKDAVTKIDGYIGEIMAALKARPEYNKKEDWLVIVVSNHGGSGNKYGGPTEAERNMFALYYNEQLTGYEIQSSKRTGVLLKGTSGNGLVNASIPNDNGLYSFGDKQNFTFEMKVKIPTNQGYGYTRFAGTQAPNGAQTDRGWYIMMAQKKWRGAVGNPLNNGWKETEDSPLEIADNKWHTLTTVVKMVGDKRYMQTFTDGLSSAPMEITEQGNLNSTAPLRLGYMFSNGAVDIPIYFSEIKMYNEALTEAEIKAGLCIADMAQHPKKDNLIGYWPANDGVGAGAVFKNKAPLGYDFKIQGDYAWSWVDDSPCAPFVTGQQLAPLLLRTQDVAAQIFYWLRVPVKTEWSLEGKEWLSQFDREFIR
ncbi:alkaline phosphatase family protein [Niabella drilacis]|uniref:Concanavalin A-like lectin/glucanases superfamily protein n=1 Tax=Niabella drilacis (strain DSM 25811 / CCM 8410 / CCUG 62505 / LMG 26954 / E90) TaxID=1285928 RepID=A0A1G7B3H8_NIADE|nr:alkaline phosphatase family protein [Niabella drilacis]SDE21581.1 Concanavalin A-like lectin/glucanases superfamily protein [Niabella drilacis]